jgi:hypothetical protein
VAHGLLTAQQIKVSNSRTGFVKFPLPAEGQTLLKKAAEEGVEIETKASQVKTGQVTGPECVHFETIELLPVPTSIHVNSYDLWHWPRVGPKLLP